MFSIMLQSYRSCGVQTPRKCEMGDMAGKFGRIDIGTRAKPSRYVFNDNFLTLNGKFSGKCLCEFTFFLNKILAFQY